MLTPNGGELAKKLNALQKLSKIASGLHGQLREFHRANGAAIPMAFGECLADGGASDISKAAAATALDLLCPGWRVEAPALRGPLLRRSSTAVKRWRDSVLKRDGGICTACGSTQDLHAHHIIRWADEPLLRASIDNGATLCQPCHTKEHHG